MVRTQIQLTAEQARDLKKRVWPEMLQEDRILLTSNYVRDL